jgi:hypothetical protein
MGLGAAESQYQPETPSRGNEKWVGVLSLRSPYVLP